LQGAARNDTAARERFLAIMHVEASRMSRLIDDLLSLSRVEMREHLAPRDAVDLAGIADELTRALEPVAHQAGRKLAVEIDARPANVRGDRDELVQVLQNLMQNAIKYGRDGGLATVRIAHGAHRIDLSVTDDGIGIAPEHLPRLTERFYRVNAKDSRERGGTGLGLAIVKHIVNRHRGELRIASTIGKGSTFTVSLPRAQAGS
jgi:two-component system, OmpR family, phosphate regulon sensor histidine kinase PhoR